MIYTVTINNKEYEVEVEKGKANILKTSDVTVQSTPVAPAAIPVLAQAVTPAQNSKVVSAGENVIEAPLPGTVLEIKVSQGSNVKKGQIVMIIEAMKMENEILAPFDGSITNVYVTKGSSVSTGDALITIR